MNYIYMFASAVYIDLRNAEPSWFSGLDVLIKLKTLAEEDWRDCYLGDLLRYGILLYGYKA
jgi:hypothetical protein